MRLNKAILGAVCMTLGVQSSLAFAEEYKHKAFVKGLIFNTAPEVPNQQISVSQDGQFPSAATGSPSFLDVLVQNSGTQGALTNVKAYLDSSLFSFDQNTCGTVAAPLATLAAGSTCSIRLKFQSGTAGSFVGTLAVNADNSTNGVQSVALTAEAITPHVNDANITVQGGDASNFYLAQGDSITKSIYYVNSGNDSTLSAFYLEGLNPSVFSVINSTCGAVGAPISIAGGQTCSATVMVSSLSLGSFSENRILSYGNTPTLVSSPITVNVVEPLAGQYANYSTAAGLGPGHVAVSGSSVSVGDVEVGKSVTKYFLVNPTTSLLGPMSLSFTSSNPSLFEVVSYYPVYYPQGGGSYGYNGCSASSVDPFCLTTPSSGRESLLVGVKFKPTVAGSFNATLHSSSNNGTTPPADIQLSGTGIQPSIMSNTDNGAFGSVVFSGGNYSEKIIQFSSSSTTVALTGLNAVISGSSSFTITSNTCGTPAAPVTLSSGTCSITVRFTPAAYSTVNGTLTVSATNASNTKTISLSGTGAYNTALRLNFDSGVSGQIDSSPQALTVNHIGTTSLSNPNAISSQVSKANFGNAAEFGAIASGGTANCSYTVGNSLEVSTRNTMLDSLSTQSQFTVETWINPTAASLSGVKVVLSDYESCGGIRGWLLGLNAGKLYFNLPNAGADKVVTAPTALTAGQWYHVAVTKNGTTVYLYINGTLAISGTSFTSPSATIDSNTRLRIGNAHTLDAPFQGKIDDIRVITGSALSSGSGSTFSVPTATYP